MLVGVGISAALVAYLLATVDLPALGAQLRTTQWGWVAAAVILGPLGLWARALRWRYLFPPRSNPPGLVAATMIGYMVNNVLPLRAGEVARVYVVAHRWGHGFWTTLGTVVVERVLDGMTVVLLIGVIVLMMPVPAYLQWGALIMLVVNLVGIAVLTGMAWRPDAMQAIARWMFRHWPRLQSLVSPGLRPLRAGNSRRAHAGARRAASRLDRRDVGHPRPRRLDSPPGPPPVALVGGAHGWCWPSWA